MDGRHPRAGVVDAGRRGERHRHLPAASRRRARWPAWHPGPCGPCREEPDGSVVDEGTVTVEPFDDRTIELIPRTARGPPGRPLRARLRQQGQRALLGAPVRHRPRERPRLRLHPDGVRGRARHGALRQGPHQTPPDVLEGRAQDPPLPTPRRGGGQGPHRHRRRAAPGADPAAVVLEGGRARRRRGGAVHPLADPLQGDDRVGRDRSGGGRRRAGRAGRRPGGGSGRRGPGGGGPRAHRRPGPRRRR